MIFFRKKRHFFLKQKFFAFSAKKIPENPRILPLFANELYAVAKVGKPIREISLTFVLIN
jgi:hypothetical protein